MDLRFADLTGTNLSMAKMARADLRNANLSNAILVRTHLESANLSGARVYGVAAWDLELASTTQADLCITPEWQPMVTVDDLEVAQFVYLMLNNSKIRNVIETIGNKGVLILGRFNPPARKAVLDAVRNKLRELGYVPMMFDFERAEAKTFTETIKVLAGLSRIIIADVTNPKSAPLELQATVPDYMVPFVPLLETGEEPFSMLKDLQQYDWVMPVMKYRSIDQLLEKLETRIIRPAVQLHHKLQLRKARGIRTKSLDD